MPKNLHPFETLHYKKWGETVKNQRYKAHSAILQISLFPDFRALCIHPVEGRNYVPFIYVCILHTALIWTLRKV